MQIICKLKLIVNFKLNKIAPLLLFFCSAALLSAQDYEKEGQKPAAVIAVQSDAEKLAAEAQKKLAEGSGDVTYAQVLEKPDDLELNYAYAKTQVRKGDLKGAGATLERILLVNPELHQIRLFYAVVLFRLDSLAEAKREFETVTQAAAPEALKTEAKAYLKAIKQKENLTTVSGALSAGAEYDSNRNASPDSQKRLFLDTPLKLTGDSRRRDDTAFISLGSAELRRVVGAMKKHELFAGLAYYRADQDQVKAVNLQAFSYKLGAAYKTGRAVLTPVLTYDRVLLDRERFLSNSGAGLRLDNRLNKSTDYWVEAKYLYQDYLATPALGSNPQRRGGLYAFSAGAGRVLTPVMKLNAEAGFTAKRAAKDFNAYDGLAFTLRHSWLLGKGMFLLTSACLGRDAYLTKDAVISRKTRRDTTFRGAVVGGIPLPSIHRGLKNLKDFTLTLNLEHYSSRSTVLNYTYTNNKAALLLNYRWQAGL